MQHDQKWGWLRKCVRQVDGDRSAATDYKRLWRSSVGVSGDKERKQEKKRQGALEHLLLLYILEYLVNLFCYLFEFCQLLIGD